MLHFYPQIELKQLLTSLTLQPFSKVPGCAEIVSLVGFSSQWLQELLFVNFVNK